MIDEFRQYFKGVYTVWYRDVLGLVHDRTRLFASLIPNVILLVGLGFGFGSALGKIGAGTGVPGVPYIKFLFPMLLCATPVMSGLQSTMSIVFDREFGYMRKILIAPVSRTSVALGKVAGGITLALMQSVLYMGVAPFIGIRLTVTTTLLALVVLVLVAAVATAIGILVAARQRSMQGFQMISLLVMMPLMLLTFGSAMPSVGMGSVGATIGAIERINPVAYGIDAMRQILLAGNLPANLTMHPPLVDMLILMGSLVVLVVPGVALFSKQD